MRLETFSAQLYAKLLRLYPAHYRERYGEGMEQVFNDLCHERTVSGGSILAVTVWALGDTGKGILKERISYLFSSPAMVKHILRPLIITALILIIPLIGNQTVEGWNWTGGDFVGGGLLIFIPTLAFELVARKGGSFAYKLGAALAILTMFLIVWVNLAVGIIGDEDNPSNIMYFFAVMVAISGWFVGGVDPRRVSRAMFASAVVLVLIPLLAVTGQPELITAEPPGIPGYLMISTFLVLMFLGAGVLFRQAGLEKK